MSSDQRSSLSTFCNEHGFLSVKECISVRQGTQHYTNENKVSRKCSDSSGPIVKHSNSDNANRNHYSSSSVCQKPKNQNAMNSLLQDLIQEAFSIVHKTNNQLYLHTCSGCYQLLQPSGVVTCVQHCSLTCCMQC